VTNPHPTGKDRRLGRGLAALLGTPLDDEPASPQEATAAIQRAASQQSAARPATAAATIPATPSATAAGIAASTGNDPGSLIDLPVDKIDPNPFQPRRDFNPEEIASLAESLKRHEQLQPILVRKVGQRYQLISGERRLRASVHAGRGTVRAEVREADDRLVAELAIVENMQRKDLNPVEKALSFKRYIDQHQCKQDVLATRLGLDRSTVANLMRLLELPQDLLDAIQQGTLTAGHARALLPIGDEEQQRKLARQIQEEGWSVRMVETHVNEVLRAEEPDLESIPIGGNGTGNGGTVNAKGRAKRSVTPHIDSLQTELRHQLGTKVEIRQTSRGKGKITIHFSSAEEFERLRAVLADQSTPRLKLAG
jgi:ParB family chromosome partitioning protein